MMNDEKDERLRQLLLKNAPPASDPLFRVKVLERRERQRFQQNVLRLVGSVATLAVAIAVGINMSDGTYPAARIAIFGAAAIVTVAVYVPTVVRLWRASIGSQGIG
jgi:hypothetical protein